MIAYDIFELAKDLKKAGINEAAADAIVKFEKAKDDNINNNLITKEDLKTEIALVRKDLKTEIALVRKDIKWMICIGGAYMSITIGLLVYIIQKIN